MTNRLRVARAERRVNQRDVARAIGIGSDRYWRIENEYAEPTDAEIAKLARYLKTPALELFPGLPVNAVAS